MHAHDYAEPGCALASLIAKVAVVQGGTKMDVTAQECENGCITDACEAAVLVRILEQGARYVLTAPQRAIAERVALALSPRAQMRDFVALAERHPELRKFAVEVERFFVRGERGRAPAS